jgi:hypothetical protein
MSKVAFSGNASGTGTFTIASPNSNTDRTLSLPDASGTILTTATPGVPVNGPAFSAYRTGSQSISANVYTKVALNTEAFDTANCFDSTTNYRFTPTVAGYYQFSAQVDISAASGLTYFYVSLYKNGSGATSIFNTTLSGVVGNQNTAILLYMNGSTDYVELYVNSIAGTTIIVGAAVLTGALVRAA